MADKKISQLTAATTPLAGTEVLPVVQGGSTVKVSSDDLTVKNVRSNATTGILQVAGPGAAATRTMTVPDANFTVARTDAGQTFTGTQVMTSPRIVTSINDTNGNELVNVTATASAVNEITVANAATGNRPTISTSGNDADIGLYIAPKGSGNVLIQSSLGINATPVYKLDALSSSGAQNILRAGQSGVSNGLTISSDGTNLSYQFDTGNIKIGTAGKGIDFSANTGAAGETSSLLDWYEEGTWTVGFYDAASGGNASATTGTGYYTRIGRQVTVTFSATNIDTTGMTSGSPFYFTLPFTPAASVGSSVGSCSLESFTFPAGRTLVFPQTTANVPRALYRASGDATTCTNVTVAAISSGASDIERTTLTYFV